MVPLAGIPQRLGQHILLLRPDRIRGQGRCALIDMDGTLSLIRAGWQEVMLRLCLDELQHTDTGDSPGHLSAICRGFITRLTGQPTITQMDELTAQIRQRGGCARHAAVYKERYLSRLQAHIGCRLNALRTGEDPPDRYLVSGTITLLEGLRNRGVHLYLASGTDHDCVVEELELLRLAGFFQDRVYGARDGAAAITKRMVVDRIRHQHRISGQELLVFGDGAVEIGEGRRAGAITVGAATMENGDTAPDPCKLTQLREAGADILVPHWAEAEILLHYLFAE